MGRIVSREYNFFSGQEIKLEMSPIS
ncbi:hypothetical protein TSAR_016500 [Trichomalopsis sarcophagae]|uniref:Uncharacterized protein n=1 Tax=Trichomalopsis sarcophagae TaxID=543379 RepID=A0A232EP32_9HYME|nr:hypothetical protein TSAR_016500 [Trichomalopsis sarcophagae]